MDPRRVTFAVRPAYGLLAAVLVVAAVANGRRADAPAGFDAASESAIFVQFRLYAPEAASVRLAGSFTGWQPRHRLHETSAGVWTVTLPLHPGVHDYSFVVDDQLWLSDPHAPGVDDGFGGTASRMALLAPASPRS